VGLPLQAAAMSAIGQGVRTFHAILNSFRQAAQNTVPNRQQARPIILPDSYQLPLPVGLLTVLT